MPKLFIIAIAILFFMLGSSFSAKAGQIKADIDFEQQAFSECITKLNKIFDVDISLAGDLKDISDDKLNLNLEQATIEQAIKEMIRRTGVQSHALIFGGGNRDVRVWILKTGKKESPNSQGYKTFIHNDESPLTPEQMYLLGQQGQTFNEDDEIPLSQKQQKELEKQGAKIEAKIDDAIKPLNPEQTERLQRAGLHLKAEMESNTQPLSNEQMEKLRDQNIRAEVETENDLKPLSRGQMLLLQNKEKKE